MEVKWHRKDCVIHEVIWILSEAILPYYKAVVAYYKAFYSTIAGFADPNGHAV
jgi:hypothetical protein